MTYFCFAGNRVIDDTEGYVAGIRKALNKEGTTEEEEKSNKEGTTGEVDINKEGTIEGAAEKLNTEGTTEHHHDDKNNDNESEKVEEQKSGTG